MECRTRLRNVHAAGMLALRRRQRRAGLLFIDVDFTAARKKKALNRIAEIFSVRVGRGRLVILDKRPFVSAAPRSFDDNAAAGASKSCLRS